MGETGGRLEGLDFQDFKASKKIVFKKVLKKF
jgi:hypothetical protein